jgi:hypothetical protein
LPTYECAIDAAVQSTNHAPIEATFIYTNDATDQSALIASNPTAVRCSHRDTFLSTNRETIHATIPATYYEAFMSTYWTTNNYTD